MSGIPPTISLHEDLTQGQQEMGEMHFLVPPRVSVPVCLFHVCASCFPKGLDSFRKVWYNTQRQANQLLNQPHGRRILTGGKITCVVYLFRDRRSNPNWHFWDFQGTSDTLRLFGLNLSNLEKKVLLRCESTALKQPAFLSQSIIARVNSKC